MQHLLIPTDFSDNAWNATCYGLCFFKNKSITFHFLHVNNSYQQSSNKNAHSTKESSHKEVSDDLHSPMEQWIQKVNTHYKNPNHTFTHAIKQASFIEGIREYIHKNNIDFIVMGTKGASGIKEMTLGSKTGAVITRVKCPILVIPEKASFTLPLSIGFPTDFNMVYNYKVIHTLQEIAAVCNSSIKVLRVAQTHKELDNFQNSNRDSLKKQLRDIKHSFHVIEQPQLENAVQSFITTMQIDMIAMIAKNLNFFQRILFKPQMANISYHIHIPFLVLHE